MRVLFVIPHPPEGASGRFRVLQYLPWLRQQGLSCEVRPFMSEALYRCLYQPGRLPQKVAMSMAAVLRRCVDVVRAAQADVVMVHREALPLGTVLLERAMARLCPAVVFDFDDAIYLNHASAANAWARVFKRAEKTSAIVSLSAQVVVGNRVLEAYTRAYNPRVSVIPPPIDTEQFQCRPPLPQARAVVIGWIGSHTTAGYLRMIQRALATVITRYPEVEVRVVGAGSNLLTVPRLQLIRWDLAHEREELHRFDIGLMPMSDDEWARGKCGFKALLYMSAGIPVVASPVGITSEIVREGVNGFLATSEEVWVSRLSQLIEDRDLGPRMGQAGRTIVEEEYSLKVHAPRLLQVLRAACHDGRDDQRRAWRGRE